MLRKNYDKIKDIVLHHILHVEDSPHRIALGAAAGIFVAWTPTFGLQMILAVALAAVLRANKAVTIPMVWITNPVTNPAIYGFSYFVGHFLRTGTWSIDPAMKGQMICVMKQSIQMDIWNAPFWSRLADITWKIGLELWIGSCLIGLIIALITYPAIYYAVVSYRRHRDKKKSYIIDAATLSTETYVSHNQHDAA